MILAYLSIPKIHQSVGEWIKNDFQRTVIIGVCHHCHHGDKMEGWGTAPENCHISNSPRIGASRIRSLTPFFSRVFYIYSYSKTHDIASLFKKNINALFISNQGFLIFEI